MPPASDWYVSKRDTWLVVVIWAASAIGFGAVAAALWAACADPRALLTALVTLPLLALGPWVLYGTGYATEATELAIRGGPFRWRVAYAEIRLVEPSSNPLSSPACSLDRLLIEYGKRRILVSPLDREGFVSALAARCPQLRREGERLVMAA